MARNKHKLSNRRRQRRNNLLIWGGVGVLVAIGAAAVYLGFGGSGAAVKRSARINRTPVVRSEKQVDVSVRDNEFQPPYVSVTKGTNVTWSFDGDVPHTVTNDAGRFDSGTMSRAASFSHTFATAGDFYYSCTLHHLMEGTITVTE